MKSATQADRSTRAETRNPTTTPIACRLFTSSSDRTTHGVMRNFSSGGTYIETSQGFRPGSIVVVRMIFCPPVPSSLAAEEGLRTISLAEVKWQRELPDLNTTRYGLGLRYFD